MCNLLEDNLPWVNTLCTKYMGSRQDLEDFKSHCFVKIMQYSPNFDPSRGEGTTFISQIIRSQYFRYLEKNSKNKEFVNLGNSDTAVICKEVTVSEQLTKIIDSMPQDEQEIIKSVLDGKTFKNISEYMGVSVYQVRLTYKKATKRIKQQWKK